MKRKIKRERDSIHVLWRIAFLIDATRAGMRERVFRRDDEQRLWLRLPLRYLVCRNCRFLFPNSNLNDDLI